MIDIYKGFTFFFTISEQPYQSNAMSDPSEYICVDKSWKPDTKGYRSAAHAMFFARTDDKLGVCINNIQHNVAIYLYSYGTNLIWDSEH